MQNMPLEDSNMTHVDPKNRRRIKLINRDFQIGLMTKFIAANAAMMVLFGLVLFLFLRGEIQSNLQSAHAAYRTMGEMLLPIIVTVSLLMLGILSVSIVFVVLYASHRIAGPMFRFHQVLKDFEARNLRSMTRIRDDDHLAEIAITLENVRAQLLSDIGRLRETLTAAEAMLPTDSIKARSKLTEAKNILDAYMA
jgi:hypothetical protein